MTRERIGLIILAIVLLGFGIYDFWDGCRSGHSILRGILSVSGGFLTGFWCSGWPPKHQRKAGPPVL